jgi:hypothetical protein
MTTYKILAQSLPTANTETGIYNTPSGSASLVRSINVTNTSSTADTFDIAILEDGNVPIVNNVYVAVSANFANAAAASSTDGATWTARTMPSAQTWSNVAYGNSTLVSVSTLAAAATSTNGTTWTARTMPSSSGWYSVTFGGGTFAAVGANTAAAATSTNGITWTARTLPSSKSWYSISYGGGVFVVVSYTAAAASSTDGTTWTARTLPPGGFTKVTYGTNVFVAIGGTSRAATSTDGVTWTARTLPTTANFWSSVAYGNGVFVAGSYGAAGLSAYSTDGITWASSTMPVPHVASEWVIGFYNNIFFGVKYGTSSNAAATSTNGITWTARSLPSSTGWQNVGAGSYDSYISIDNKDYIFKSTPILGNETVTVKAGYTMSQNDQVRVRSNNGTSNFHIFGGEI